ncbi:guided entry of tail-anchored proteins factor 1-like [Achroia grisella]|uniref:guided entry of tail-anchored proteins factor 1-like n=1 Tax=Achroia grisella TaxID=688607 RepID=UPI0027D1E9B1|nr:guided entry of tail-anchored proteins factor 1-like [Achroia grisella]
MLEVINGFLMIYFIILCSISALVPHLVKPIIVCFIRPSNEERTAWTEIQKLKSMQKTISMKEEFAAYSKIQRRINKLETQLKDDSQSRMSKSFAIKSSVQIVFQVVVALLMIVSVIWFRQEPIVALKGDLFPLTTFLRYPSSMPNAISTHMWVIISNFSIRTLLKPVLS